jgi:hypothetical protein
MARLPQIKTLEQFKWSWPQKINRLPRCKTSSGSPSSKRKAT